MIFQLNFTIYYLQYSALFNTMKRLISVIYLVCSIVYMSNAQTATPAIFYSPHQDDEAIGMAGAIQEQKEKGRQVYLVLLTNGVNRGLLDVMNGKVKCTLHNTYHHFNLTQEQVNQARRVEFMESAKKLGVDSIFIAENGLGIDDNLAHTSDLTRKELALKIANVVRDFERRFPGASHKLCGRFDGNKTHTASWEAANLLYKEGITDFRFYRIYEYYKPEHKRTAQYRLTLTPHWLSIKRNALDEYMYFNEAEGRYALGYHSVKGLIDNAYTSSFEYFDLINYNGTKHSRTDSCEFLYPNPARSYLNVKLHGKGKTRVELVNFKGQIIFTSNLHQFENRINMEEFPRGIYIIRFITDKEVRTQKIILE